MKGSARSKPVTGRKVHRADRQQRLLEGASTGRLRAQRIERPVVHAAIAEDFPGHLVEQKSPEMNAGTVTAVPVEPLADDRQPSEVFLDQRDVVGAAGIDQACQTQARRRCSTSSQAG